MLITSGKAHQYVNKSRKYGRQDLQDQFQENSQSFNQIFFLLKSEYFHSIFKWIERGGAVWQQFQTRRVRAEWEGLKDEGVEWSAGLGGWVLGNEQ